MTKGRWNVAIVGPGNVGLVFGQALRNQGDAISAVISKHASSARNGGRYLHCRTFGTSLELIPRNTDAVLLTVPHAAVEVTARELALLSDLPFRSMAFCHASGMLTAHALEPLAAKGAAVVSFHPLQTFPRDFKPAKLLSSLPGIWYGIDGDPRGMRFAKQLALRLKGKTVVIPPELRVYYHAACVVASNHLTALLGLLEEMHRVLGIKGSAFMTLFRPIIESTFRNVVETSPARALSGPVARGGTETIGKHLETIRQHSPELLPLYAALTMATVRLAQAKGSIDERRVAEFGGLIDAYHIPLTPMDQNR